MIHRVSYAQIIDTLSDFSKPITFEELYNSLPCEPDCIVLQTKIDNLIKKGKIKIIEDEIITTSSKILYSIN